MATFMHQHLDNPIPDNSDRHGWEVQPTDLKPAEPSWEQIAAEAYDLFKSRGDRDGSDLEDWLEAERRLRARATAIGS